MFNDQLSDFCEEGILRLLFNKTVPVPSGAVYLAVGTSPATDGSVDSWSGEVSGGGYVRQLVEFCPRATPGATWVNDRNVIFPQASAGWGSISSWAIWSAASGGKMLAFGNFTSLTINSGDRLRVPKGSVSLEYYTGAGLRFSRYLYHKLLNHVFAKQAFTSPNIYLALVGTEPTAATTGSQLDEPSGNGYARKAWSAWTNPAQTVDGDASAANSGAINFNDATGNWSPAIGHAVFVDAASGGNVLCWVSLGASTSIMNADTPHFEDAALEIQTG